MARGTGKTERLAGLDAGLKAMFRALKNRPLPDGIRSVVDQLDQTDEAPAKGRRRG